MQHESAAMQSMVDRLAERLKASPYIALGENQKAAEAVKRARSVLATDAPKLQLFNDTLQRLEINDMNTTAGK